MFFSFCSSIIWSSIYETRNKRNNSYSNSNTRTRVNRVSDTHRLAVYLLSNTAL